MTVIEELLNEYSRMRENGLDSKATLHALRPYIEPLPDAHKAELAKHLRQYEKGDRKPKPAPPPQIEDTVIGEEPVASVVAPPDAPTRPAPPPNRPVAPPPNRLVAPPPAEDASPIKRIKPMSPIKPVAKDASRPGEELMPQGLKPGATWISCPNCNTKNKANEIFCYACGHLMDSGQGYNSTRSFAPAATESYPPEHFGRDSILIVTVRDSGSYFKLRPQNYTHELVIGRSSSNTAMTPDIDLTEENAEELGVSRLHLAVQYMMENDTLVVFDLGSANGSFINGQKLHPSERRILRNGDELRIGRMVTRATYEHPGQEIE